MAIVDLVMPKLGESIMEATILKWHKSPGDQVKMDETVLDIATDKVDSEVPSGVEGILEETLYGVNDVVPVGAVIARIKTNAEEVKSTPPVHAVPNSYGAPHTQQPFTSQPAANGQPSVGPRQAAPGAGSDRNSAAGDASRQYKPAGNSGRFYSPLVL